MHLVNAKFATLDADNPSASGPCALLENGSLVAKDGRIRWIGPTAELPESLAEPDCQDMQGRLITPALIDCHTHLVHAGHRAAEFEMRLEGANYEDIARAGGGIVSTMDATRRASVDGLLANAFPRVDALIAEGVGTVEIKSGYGLDQQTELNMLRAARRLAQHRSLRVRTSFLGAHSVPPEYNGKADAYIDEICIPTLELAHAEGLVDAVDGFCEGIAFDTRQIARVFDAARRLSLPVKLHAEQLSHIGGTALAARYGALSADHLEYAHNEDAALMAESGTTAVLLPGAFYTLRETQLPPIDAFRKHGVAMALATDCNPGSSPMSSLLLAMNMACTLFRMTPAEALAGVTHHAAEALGLDDAGKLKPGYRADLAIWDIDHPAELAYRIGANPLHQRLIAAA